MDLDSKHLDTVREREKWADLSANSLKQDRVLLYQVKMDNVYGE